MVSVDLLIWKGHEELSGFMEIFHILIWMSVLEGFTRKGHQWKQWQTISLGSKITSEVDCSHEITKTLAPWKESYDKPRQHIKKQRHYFADKVSYSQSYDFCSSHVWM